jgi:hypothetical protein
VLVQVGPFCRKGLSPPGEPRSRHLLSNGKVLALQTGWADVAAPVAHKVATSREVLPGRQDLLKIQYSNRGMVAGFDMALTSLFQSA